MALATSAAPTYFKRHRIGENEYIDGGLFANSPSLVGLHEAEIFFKHPINQVRILSIGTLSSKKTINPKTNKKGGLTDWGEGDIRKAAPNIIDITLSSQQLFMNQLVKHRIKDNFVVIDENLTHSSAPYVGLDDATNEAKEILAFELTKLVHGEEEATKAREASHALFAGGGDSAHMPTVELSAADFADGDMDILSLLVKTELAPSRSDARRAVEQGGVSVADEKVTDIKTAYNADSFGADGLVVKRGKKKFVKVLVK